MTSIFTVLALHSCCIFKEVSAKSAAHDVIELLLYKFVTILLMDLLFSLSNGTFTVKTYIERPAIFCLFDCQWLAANSYNDFSKIFTKTHCKLYPAHRLERKP